MNRSKKVEFQSEDQQTCVANAAMLREIAAGRYKPKKADEVERRFNAVLTYVLTGRCEADDQTRRIVEQFGRDLKPLAQSAAA